MKKFLNLFSYCGVSKEEYNSVKRTAYVSNFTLWKYLHLFIAVVFVFLAAASFVRTGFSQDTRFRIMLIFYFIIVFGLFSGPVSKTSVFGQLVIYFSMIMLFLYTFYSAMLDPTMNAVAFVIMLVLLPMLMIDRPFYVAIMLVIASAVFIIGSSRVSVPAVFEEDAVNVVCYCVVGIFINTFYNCIRVREFLYHKRDIRHVEEQKQTLEKSNRLNLGLQKMSESLIEVLGDVVESRDADSGDHIQRVKGYTYILANEVKDTFPEYGLDEYAVNLMMYAAALHDVGKISIPDAILLKPGRLTEEEFDVMKTHCVKGCEILNKMANAWDEEYLKIGVEICRSHHEKWDGKGYPDGLAGDQIPLSAQIVAVADIFDALTTERVYKAAYPPEEAFRMIMDGECGAMPPKILTCLEAVKDSFFAYAKDPAALKIKGSTFDVIASKTSSGTRFVIGIHDEDRTLREKIRLGEELSVISSLSEKFYYVCYVDMKSNEVIRFKADPAFERILDGFGDTLPSNKRFDMLLNTTIVQEDYDNFRRVTHRETAMEELGRTGHVAVSFRIRLEDGVHYCRMRITPAPTDPGAVVIGIINMDEEHVRENESVRLQHELEVSKREAKDRERLEDQLAVINSVSNEYDYVCSIAADTMQVTVYRAAPWLCDMIKNLEDIVKSDEARNALLKGIVYPEDFEAFRTASRHENVLKGLYEGRGDYRVNYRAYKYGRLVSYQTKYTLDPNNPRRIIIGLHSVGGTDSAAK